jgi:hypothetical protein
MKTSIFILKFNLIFLLDRLSFCSDVTFVFVLINLNPFFFFGLKRLLKSCAVVKASSLVSVPINNVLLFSFDAPVFENNFRLRSRSSSP